VRAGRVSGTTRPVPRMIARPVPGLITRPFLGLGMELVEASREVEVQRVSRRARGLASELHSWIALLGAGKSL
jgi:hypothetical protein